MRKVVQITFAAIISVLLPIVIVFSVVRVLMTPSFPVIEYNMPAFPDDPYGFTKADRLKWSKLSVEYLLNQQDIHFFDPYQLDDGSPLYNNRELSHMDDVKILVQKGLRVYNISLIVFVVSFLFLMLTKDKNSITIGLRNGGYFTIGLMIAIFASVAIDFDAFFSWFHSLFFTGDSWIFYYSDTFIRLFPIRFWMDCFIYLSAISLILSICAIIYPKKLFK